MDLQAIINLRPEVVIVDELAHTNIEGSKNEKRWQDVIDILSVGINVISAVNIQHIESLNDEIKDIKVLASPSEYEYKNNKITHYFDDAFLIEGENVLKVVVTDNVGNSTIFETRFFRSQKK